MDEETDRTLVGKFSSFNSFLPGIVMNRSALFHIQTKANRLCWGKEGKELLTKDYFNEEDKNTAKLLILKGIPDDKRGELWFVSTGAKKGMLDHPKYYNFLLNDYPNEIELPNENQIDKDINRTFPEDNMFHLPDTKKKLKNILLCYSKRNLSIGYVQGFNFIVGRILKFIPEEEKAFWVFCQIIESILPLNFYSSMSGLIADIDILLGLFKEMYMPEFSDLMKESHFIYLKNVLLQWFLSIFVINFPFEASTAIWDILFIDKSVVLFKIGIYLIKLIKEKLLEIKDMEKFKDFIRDYFDNFSNLNYIKFVLLLRKFEFDQKFIDHNRTVFLKPIVDKINKNSEDKLEKLKENIKERTDYCDPDWPFCIYDCDSYYQVVDYLVLRQGGNVSIIENYFDKKNKNHDHSNSRKIDINYENAIIERKPHICRNIKPKKTILFTDRQYTADSDSSIISFSSENSNDEITEDENNYYLKKAQFKNRRTKSKCISTISFMRSQKKTSTNINKDYKNFNQFLSKMNYQYNICSVAKEVPLLKKEENHYPEMLPLSLKI